MAKIITYDLCAPGRDYTKLIEAIKTYPNWGHVTESTWVINTTDTCTQVRDNLKKHMDQNDRIFVGELSGVAAWYNVLCDNQWLKDALNK